MVNPGTTSSLTEMPGEGSRPSLELLLYAGSGPNTQIAVEDAVAELGWLDVSTAENGTDATEYTNS